jgi:two-component system response regulator FlrC
VVAATNKDLRQAIDAREFREDLYFRISTFRLRIQPLRERPLDIMPLVMQSLARHGEGGVAYSVTTEAQQLLEAYPWPGNVRELENVVQRAVVLCTGQTITPAHLLFDEMSSLMRGAETEFNVVANVRADVREEALSDQTDQVGQPMQSATAMSGHAITSNPTPSDAAAQWVQSEPLNARELPALEQASSFSVVGVPPQAIEIDAAPANLQDVIKSSEHAVIMSAIQNTDSREEAARLLGISPRTLRYKLAQLRERGLMLNAA